MSKHICLIISCMRCTQCCILISMKLHESHSYMHLSNCRSFTQPLKDKHVPQSVNLAWYIFKALDNAQVGDQQPSESLVASWCWEGRGRAGQGDDVCCMVACFSPPPPSPWTLPPMMFCPVVGQPTKQPTNLLLLLLLRPVTGRRYHHSSQLTLEQNIWWAKQMSR